MDKAATGTVLPSGSADSFDPVDHKCTRWDAESTPRVPRYGKVLDANGFVWK